LSTPEQALVSFEDIELGDHGVEAGGAVLTAQLRQWPSLPRRHWAFPQKQNESAACLAICHDVNASNLTKGWKSAVQSASVV